jgi:peptidyl-prolyl cis-trans isomerase D
MTMLDRMRRHKSWLKWSLLLVCLAFVIFYIPAFLNKGPDAVASDSVASVDGRDITVSEFRRAYQTQLQVYRQAYGGNISEQMLKQLGISQQILQQMVDEQAALSEARRQGIDVTDGEVAQRIYSMPAFQENGQFIGQPRYAAMLRMQRPPMTAEELRSVPSTGHTNSLSIGRRPSRRSRMKKCPIEGYSPMSFDSASTSI